ncbi:S8 family peptidase [Streptosporangium subroseum]|uniref:S8 family peptidase n=1 Tax=Streptosporangium subroseum TaxID=106412 RepID=UPI00308D8ECF|nr:S8 family serine peptidase [Streptosporangium subroseum]
MSRAAAKPPEEKTFTLLTGDVVRLRTAADGSATGEVVNDVAPLGDITFQRMTGGLYALTGEMVRQIAAGKLDRELFNLTKLAEYGYDDAHTKQLPVIATYQDTQARTAMPAAPKGTSRKRTLTSVKGQALAVDKSRTTDAWAALKGRDTQKVWLDGRVKASLDVSVPAVGAPVAWSAGLTGKGVKIGVVDTGIDRNHPDFAGRIAASQSFVPGSSSAADDNGHGTHVASIAAGSGAASDGKYRGVAPDAELVVAKALDAEGSGASSDIIAGMEWAANQGAKVINMSVGGLATDGTDPLSQAVNQISEATGALFVVAAGNDGVTESPYSIGSPGAADQALTVGSVAKTAPYERSYFSSWGPRVGDNAVKPEITAPGAEIAAARAAGSTLGGDVGNDRYQSLSGTSMAAPHVAGGAALLAQQHPDWSRGQIRDTLVSTANPGKEGEVTREGAGMMDLAQAAAGGLSATGTLNLGMLRPPYKTATGTVTLRNTGTEAVHATLGLTLSTMDTKMVEATPFAPGEAVTMTPSAVDVPAGGTATVTVTVNPEALELGAFFGFLEARHGDTVVRTTLGWTKDAERARLKVRGIDRTGTPAHTTCCSLLGLMDLETGQDWLGLYDHGSAYFIGLGYDPMLLLGRRYALMTNISDWTVEEPYFKLSESIAGEPELVMDGPRELVFDMRKARRVEYSTRRPTEAVDRMSVGWDRRVGTPGNDLGAIGQSFHGSTSPAEVYVLPGTTTATTGTFMMGFGTQLVAPALTMKVTGPRAPELHPAYPLEYSSACYFVLRCTATFRSSGAYQVVDAGKGSPAELAAARVRGKLALVDETLAIDEWDTVTPLDQVAADAAAAGAAGVLLTVADAGPARRTVEKPTTVPVAVLTHNDGERLGAAAAKGRTTVETGGDPVSPFLYDLAYAVKDKMPTDTAFETEPRDLATVTARYRADTPGTLYRVESSAPSNLIQEATKVVAPFTRTEYVSPGVRRQFVQQTIELREESLREYAAGTRVTEDYFSAPIAPGPTGPGALTALSYAQWGYGYISLNLSPLRVGNGYHYLSQWPQSTIRYLKNGNVLCETAHISGCTVQSPTPGRHRIELDTQQSARPLSTSSRTAWEFDVRFDSHGSAENEAGEILPMVDVRYDVALNPNNTVRAGSKYSIKLLPGYQPGYSGSDKFSVRAWVSGDDGAKWTDLGSRKVSGGKTAGYEARAPRNGEFVTLRVEATDSAGNSIDQTITRAWRAEQR